MDQSRLGSVYTDQKFVGSQQQIRLIHLLPAHRDETIRCTLHTVDLQQIEHSEALSYVWGRHLAPETISINGIPFPVTENLFHALKHLRLARRERVLWVDAICINQSDVNERNQQVKKMAYIYSQSRQVIGWLGMKTEASQAAFRFLATSYHHPRNRRDLAEDFGWQVLKDVYQRGYWKRVWIVQEICLARQLVLVCGDTEIPWKYLSELYKARLHCWPQYLSQGERDFMRSPLSRVTHAKETHQKNGCILWTLLETFAESDCQELHDKIYGFLGVASDCGNEDIPIDYSRSISQLYGDVVRFYHGIFQRHSSSPHSAQLMKFSEFLGRYLERHPRCSVAWEYEETEMKPQQASEQKTTVRHDSMTMMQISASDAMFIDKFPSSEDASKFAGSELVNFLEKRKPYSHIGFWRDFIDPSVSEVYPITTSKVVATCHIAMPHKAEQQEEITRPSVFITSTRNGFGSQDRLPVLGIAPPNSKTGDMLCTFVDSHIALVMRPVPEEEDSRIISTYHNDHETATHTHVLIGRAYLDFQYMERIQQLKSRLTSDKTVELVTSTDSTLSVYGTPWSATLSIDLGTLRSITKAVKTPGVTRSSNRQLKLLPSNSLDTDSSCTHSSERFVNSSELSGCQANPWIKRYIHGPGYAGIKNLGATGYLSCVLQIMYILKPFRTEILQMDIKPDLGVLTALQSIFQRLRVSLLPVSPEDLIRSFGWTTQINETHDVFEVWRSLSGYIIAKQNLNSLRDLISGSYILKSGESQREELFLDIPFSLQDGDLLNSLRIACNSFKNAPDHAVSEFQHLPPVLILNGKFVEHDLATGITHTVRDSFEYPRSFLFSEVANLGDTVGLDAIYQLRGIVVHEAVEPVPRYILYLKPREDDQWVLFFNETVTFASHQEVFEDTFRRATGPDGREVPLRTPCILIYMKASMIGALLEGGAEKPQVPVMETRKLKLGGDHPDTLTSMNNLAEKMYQRGQGYRSTTQSEHSTVASTLATYADRTQIVSAELQLSNQYMDLHQASVDPTHNGKFSLLPPFPHATKHTSCIYSMALTKNHLITASRDQTLIIWDLESYQPTNILRGHTGSVLSVCTSEALEEKILIYSGGVDGSVICWDLENGSLIREIKALHDDSVLHIAINDEYLFTSSKDKKIKVWHRHSWFASSAQNWRTRLFPTPVTVLTAHSAAVNCVTLTPHQLITGSGDRSIHIWKLGVPWRCVKTILHNKKGVASVAVSKNGRKIVSGSSDYTVRIFDTETGEEDACLLGHEGLVRCVIILPAADTTGAADDDDMDAIVSTGYDGRTILWRKQNEGGWVQAGSFDIKEAFKMYKKSEGKYLNNYSTRCFSVRSDGNRVFISSQLPSVAIWQLP